MPRLDLPQRVHFHGFATSLQSCGVSSVRHNNLAGTGPANIRPFLVRACCYDCLIALIDPFFPSTRGSAGWWKPAFRRGTVVCPDYPVAVNGYMPNALVVAEAVL